MNKERRNERKEGIYLNVSTTQTDIFDGPVSVHIGPSASKLLQQIKPEVDLNENGCLLLLNRIVLHQTGIIACRRANNKFVYKIFTNVFNKVYKVMQKDYQG